MSDYSDSEHSLLEDFQPSFKAPKKYPTKSPSKIENEEKVKLVHSKVTDQEEPEDEGESEDSEFNEDEEDCDEDEMFMRKRKKELKAKSKSKTTSKRGKKASEPSEEEEEGEESEEESSEPLEPKELPQRSSRGQRMHMLVGKALEEDEAFWGADVFQENNEDDDFSANSSEAKDSFDSDFDRSEHSQVEGEEEFSAEREVRMKEKKEKKKVKFAVPAQKKKIKKKPRGILKKKVVKKEEEDKEDKDKDADSQISEPILATKRSKRLADKKEEESSDSEAERKERRQYSNNPQKNLERKREIKEKHKAFLEQHGIVGDVQEKWSELLSKEKLSPIEKIQEAALTEIINKESLSYLQELENERVNEMVYRDRRPKGPSVKLIQDVKPGHYNSRMVFPSSDFYPKNFNTRKQKNPGHKYLSKSYQMNTCMITGKRAKYKEPLTLTPFANQDGFRVIRERYFQKEEDKINMRIHVINELLNQKKDKLKRYQSYDRNLEISQEQREVIMRNAQK